MSDYIRKYSAGDLISTSFSIYRQNFLVLFLVYILPTLPALVLSTSIKHIAPDNPELAILSEFSRQLVSLLVIAPITVAVSDICLGNKPSIRRSYMRPLDVIGKLTTTFIIVNIIMFIGYMLLIIPGLIATVILMFAITTVVLERLGPIDAIRRSACLGKGNYWRNFGVLFLIFMIIFIPLIIVIIAGDLVMGEQSAEMFSPQLIEHMITTVTCFFAPLFFIIIVLLYYDMRVRKENFDATAFAQDFMR